LRPAIPALEKFGMTHSERRFYEVVRKRGREASSLPFSPERTTAFPYKDDMLHI